MRSSGHNGNIRGAAHGYEPTREAAMAAFAKSWCRSQVQKMMPLERTGAYMLGRPPGRCCDGAAVLIQNHCS